ncbi:MAG: hypothetical protein IJL18_04760 [Synergistaceae bacterium]|nr:hypothetical protein [Synergistaceae bacterium]MBQ6002144.1 hypothetical protein [Synergistaceae bacterium]
MNALTKKNTLQDLWALIPEEEPDDFDLEMLEAIERDPDCHIFITDEELKKSLGMTEYEYHTA